MIYSFKDKDAQELYERGTNRRYKSFERVALRKLKKIAGAKQIETLRLPSGNHLEALVGDRKGQWSIRVNDKWRLCFRWSDKSAKDVEIVDYHH